MAEQQTFLLIYDLFSLIKLEFVAVIAEELSQTLLHAAFYSVFLVRVLSHLTLGLS